jgi:hypothetical protein
VIKVRDGITAEELVWRTDRAGTAVDVVGSASPRSKDRAGTGCGSEPMRNLHLLKALGVSVDSETVEKG